MKTLAFKWVGSVLVLCQSNVEPSDAEWNSFLDEMRKGRGATANFRIVVFTDGGGPSASQRGRISGALGGGSVKAAVISDSILARFIVSSVALINKSIRSFNKSDAAQAYSYLGLTPAEAKLVEAARQEMIRSLA